MVEDIKKCTVSVCHQHSVRIHPREYTSAGKSYGNRGSFIWPLVS